MTRLLIKEVHDRLRRAAATGGRLHLDQEHVRALMTSARIMSAIEEDVRDEARSDGEPTPPFDEDLSQQTWGRTSFVYFIQAPNGAIKIGKAVDLRRRIVQLQGANPDRLSLLGAFLAQEGHEDLVHQHFWRDRIRGEWFRPSPALVGLIESLERTDAAGQPVAREPTDVR